MVMQQEPIKIGGTYHRKKAYFGLCLREYPHKIWPEKVINTDLPFGYDIHTSPWKDPPCY